MIGSVLHIHNLFNDSIFLFQIIILFQVIYWGIISYLKHNKTLINWHTLFLTCFVFFIASRPLFDLFGIGNLRQTEFFTSHVLNSSILSRTLLNVNLSLMFFFSSIFFFSFKKNPKIKVVSLKFHRYINISLVLLSPFMLAFTMLKIQFIIDYGYLAYHLGEERIPFQTILKFISSIYIVLFTIILSSKIISKKIFWVSFVLLFLVFISDGRRGPALILILVLMLNLQSLNNYKVRLTKLFIIVPIILAIIIIVRSLRFNSSLDLDIISLLYGQGISLQTVSYAIEYESSIHYSLLNIVDSFFRTLSVLYNKIIGIENDLTLSSKVSEYKIYSTYLSYIVNSKLYFSGFGIGGSFISELFSIGREYVQVLGSFIIGFIFNRSINYNNSSNSVFLRAAYLLILMSLVYIPRDNIFDFITDNIIGFLLLFLIQIISNLKWKKEKLIL